MVGLLLFFILSLRSFPLFREYYVLVLLKKYRLMTMHCSFSKIFQYIYLFRQVFLDNNNILADNQHGSTNTAFLSFFNKLVHVQGSAIRLHFGPYLIHLVAIYMFLVPILIFSPLLSRVQISTIYNTQPRKYLIKQQTIS